MTVWFDVEDLFHHQRSGAKRVSGIQRLTLEIYRAAVALEDTQGGIGFVRHGSGPGGLVPVAWADVEAGFAEPAPSHASTARQAPGTLPRLSARRIARQAANTLPLHIKEPLVLGGVLQVQAVAAGLNSMARLVLFPATAGLRWGTARIAHATAWLRQAPAPPTTPPHAPPAFAQPGDTLLVLGSPWFRDYALVARHVRDVWRMRFGVLVHDLVPVRHPEWCHEGIVRTAGPWYAAVLPYCDVVLANSAHTAADVEAFARERGIALPGPVRPVPVGTGFGGTGFGGTGFGGTGLGGTGYGTPPPGRRPQAAREMVLFVSTMEARKNHALMVRVWRRLLADVTAGRRAADTVPDLVFAGRVGWLVADLVQQLENTGWLDGRVRLVENPSDAALRTLYESALFTVFPSFYEGFGLPVSESLAFGTPCLSSNAAALPEAGGALARYFDPDDAGSAYRAVAALLDDRPALEAWRAEVRRDFKPTPWSDTAAAVLAACARPGPPGTDAAPPGSGGR